MSFSKSAILSALLLLGSVLPVFSQTTSDLPQCALGCARAAADRVDCALTNTLCLCKTTFASAVLQCSGATSCSPEDQSQVSKVLLAMCASTSGSASGALASPSFRSIPSISFEHNLTDVLHAHRIDEQHKPKHPPQFARRTD
ncbi:hypothetical protein C8J57DRAFT_724644 [Mycena rebaudengoi]|nr:hypothetical protein C8J57DRAFT_724644 [Mycena rebaudengoi]